jgi:hypothetical protein
MGTKGSSRLTTLHTLWSELYEPFKTKINDIIENNDKGSSLLRLLRLIPNKPVELPTSLFEIFMSFYNIIYIYIYIYIYEEDSHMKLNYLCAILVATSLLIVAAKPLKHLLYVIS